MKEASKSVPYALIPFVSPNRSLFLNQGSLAIARGAKLVNMNSVVCHRNEEGTLVGHPMPVASIQAPPISGVKAHEEYPANFVLKCFMCHSASFQTDNELEPALSEGYYGGGNPMQGFDGQVVLSSNLTAHPEYGLGR